MNNLLPSFQEESLDSLSDGVIGGQQHSDGLATAGGHSRMPSESNLKSTQGSTIPFFPEVDALLDLFKDSCKELGDLSNQVYEVHCIRLFGG